MKRVHWIALALLMLISVFSVTGCKDKRTMISKILERPDKYVGHEVKIAGEVTKTYSVNLILAEAGAYQIDDGSGKIWVVTRTGVPREGAKVGLRGDVSSGLKIAGQLFGAVIQEQERRYR